MNAIVTAWVQDFDGIVWEVALYDCDDCTIEDHIDFVLEGIMTDDELINIVIH